MIKEFIRQHRKEQGIEEASVGFEKAYQDFSKAFKTMIKEIDSIDKKSAKQMQKIWGDIDEIISAVDPME